MPLAFSIDTLLVIAIVRRDPYYPESGASLLDRVPPQILPLSNFEMSQPTSSTVAGSSSAVEAPSTSPAPPAKRRRITKLGRERLQAYFASMNCSRKANPDWSP